MEKSIWKPFTKYTAFIAIALWAINLLVFFDLDDFAIVYMFYIYMPILLIAAPIAFGIYYGHYLSNNSTISLKKIIKISGIIFIFSCVIYAIPACKWLLGNERLLRGAGRIIFLPAALSTLFFFCSVTIFQRIKKPIYYKIRDKFYEDLDIKWVLNYYKRILQNKKRVDYKYVLFHYLNYLTIALEFEEFRKVYLENRSFIQKKFNKSQLEDLRNIFLSISNDQHRQKESVFQYVYSPYHTKKGQLSRLASYLRERDVLQELSQHYILKEYELIIEKVMELEKDDFGENYVKHLLQSLKERSLYHLGSECHLPEDKYRQVLSGYKWWYLIEIGREYYYEEAEEFVSMIDYDLEYCRRKKWKIM